jgi:phospholipid/cholesterol/gamma-HCH transport system permease protein
MIKTSIENIGGKTIDFFVSVFDALRITLISLLYLFLPTSYNAQMRETLTKQIYYTSIQPLVICLFLAFFFGTAILGGAISLATQYNLQDKIGLIIIKFSINEFAPFFTALFMALHSGTYINAALMQKKQNKEVDSSVETLVHILLPRVLSGVLSALTLGVLVSLVVLTSGYILVFFYLHMQINAYLFMLGNLLEAHDIGVFIFKSVAFGSMSMFLPVYLALRSESKTQLLSHKLLKNMLKILIILFFIEVVSFVIQSL